MTTEKKMVNRSVAIGLVGLSIVLIVALGGVVVYYTMFKISGNEPKLINVGVGAVDLGSSIGQPKLHISGYIVNAGSSNAYNSKVHVIAYFISGAKAIDYLYDLQGGIIHGYEYVHFEADIEYSSGGTGGVSAGTATLTPVWTTSP
jgi:hypothetical protein